MNLERRISAARGATPPDVVFRGGSLINVLSGEVERADVAVADGVVVAIGPEIEGPEEIDCGGRWIAPGLLDAHMHLESTMVTLAEFARAVVPRGTTAVVLDPHEIANVHGAEGIGWVLASRSGVPLSTFVMASSCVPATHMETAGARLEADDLAPLRDEEDVLGLAEVMNFPGVVGADPDLLAKLTAFEGAVVDGHAPGLSGRALDAYVAAGPRSDHECTTLAEGREKLRKGMRILIREGSTARNLDALLPLVTPASERRCCFATDDRHPADLLAQGHIDHVVRRAIAAGLPLVTAYRLATLNTAEWFELDRSGYGFLAPGSRADLIVLEDAEAVAVKQTWRNGIRVALDGRLEGQHGATPAPPRGEVTLPRGWWERLPVRWRDAPVRVIGVLPGQIVTERREARLSRDPDGFVALDAARPIGKLAVVERHGRSGGVGVAFVEGLAPPRGAIASSVAHDSHNIIVAGADDASMRTAVEAVARANGGLAAADGEHLLSVLPLPIAGLMSDRPLEEVASALAGLDAAYRALGGSHGEPFMALSFLALPVIPALKLTDRGLVDVERFEIVPIWTED